MILAFLFLSLAVRIVVDGEIFVVDDLAIVGFGKCVECCSCFAMKKELMI
jgi:hypothetical protein